MVVRTTPLYYYYYYYYYYYIYYYHRGDEAAVEVDCLDALDGLAREAGHLAQFISYYIILYYIILL